MDTVLVGVALLGHGIFWAALLNRAHSFPMSHWVGRWSLPVCTTALMAIPGAVLLWAWLSGQPIVGRRDWFTSWWPGVLDAYLVLCWSIAGLTVPAAAWRQGFRRLPASVRAERKRATDVLRVADGPDSGAEHHFLVRFPGNESLRLDIVERDVEIDDLDKTLEGVKIAHLSDSHFTGRIAKPFFEEIARITNEHRPDLVVITGDLFDSVECLDWAGDTFGALRADGGVCFILGNHDLEVGVARIRTVLREHGLIDVAHRWLEVSLRGRPVILAGNEVPWIPPAADMSDAPPRRPGGPLRIGLSHSPDQLRWARENEMDLLFAGHLHGGQIRMPVVGPLLAPSRLGVKYASGIFHHGPTLMQVSRGLSGELPLRLNCPPELIFMTLHRA